MDAAEVKTRAQELGAVIAHKLAGAAERAGHLGA